MAQLRTTLANQSASPDELNKALTAVRDARTKAQHDLKAAQADLKKLLKVRQEAVLVADGMLE
jgi:hypothetical protein